MHSWEPHSGRVHALLTLCRRHFLLIQAHGRTRGISMASLCANGWTLRASAHGPTRGISMASLCAGSVASIRSLKTRAADKAGFVWVAGGSRREQQEQGSCEQCCSWASAQVANQRITTERIYTLCMLDTGWSPCPHRFSVSCIPVPVSLPSTNEDITLGIPRIFLVL